MAQGFRGRSEAHNTFQKSRIGPEPNASEIQLRSNVSRDVLSALWVPNGLYDSQQGAVVREAYRQWHASGLVPMGEAFRAELEEKLERPVTINFNMIAGADIAARGRALKQFIDSGVEPDYAASAIGMPGIPFVEPEPAPQMSGVPDPEI